MASLGGEQQFSTAAEPVQRIDSRESSVERRVIKDRDEKLKLARERQNEERQRKIEELKAQAAAAQKYREQKEEERKRRIEEIRNRDSEKRQQVEERKRAIMEAEKERREYILRKNQERDSRMETKRRDRNSISFAFGSSTPRLLEPAEFGNVSPSTFWGQRRSTSISNVAGASTLSRRSSERELVDSGAKKRATSASGTDRHDGSRSGNVTPGGSIGVSRPGSAMSSSTAMSMSTSGYVPRRSAPVRKPRPASIAGTGASLEEINKLKRENRPPAKTSTPSASAQTTPKRIPNMMSTSMIVTSSSSRLSSAERKSPAKRESTTPKTSTPKSLSKTSIFDRLNKIGKERPKASPASASAPVPTPASEEVAAAKPEKDLVAVVKSEEAAPPPSVAFEAQLSPVEKMDTASEKSNGSDAEPSKDVPAVNGNKESHEVHELTPPPAPVEAADLMTASMLARSKITTEEEAKAALAERRRLAREEAERQAELERQRVEVERLAELQRQEDEAERQRLFEEEAMRLAETQRSAEEERLRQAIEEAQQREEEEKLKREEEERQRLEREEAEKKAKEEAEKQRLETVERLKREEKEREERRKRVEAIMSRTRRAGAAATPNSTPVKENNEGSAKAETEAEAPLAQSQTELTSSENSSTSGSTATTTATTPTPVPAPTPTAASNAVSGDKAVSVSVSAAPDAQTMYEQSVLNREDALIKNFSNLIIEDEVGLKSLQQKQIDLQQQFVEVSNGRLHNNCDATIDTTSAVANGNGHIDNINNKNNISLMQDVVAPTANQLIDFSLESQDFNDAVNFNNNNNNNNNNTSLFAPTTGTPTLVTADSHENKDISLL